MTQETEFLNYEFTYPRRHNFADKWGYNVACCAWVLWLGVFTVYTGIQMSVVFMRWDAYEGTTRVECRGESGEVAGCGESAKVAAKYRAWERVPFLDVCEDQLQPIESFDRSDPPFIVPDFATNKQVLVQISASYSYYINGRDALKAGLAEHPSEGKLYYEATPGLTQHVMRNDVKNNKKDRYRCYRFMPPQLKNETKLGPDDRIDMKWVLKVKGKLPEERLTGYAGNLINVIGLLYRISLAQEYKNSWAFHYEGVNSAFHDLRCTRNIQVQGEVHNFRWVNSLGMQKGRGETDTFEASVFDPESGCWAQGPCSTPFNLNRDSADASCVMTDIPTPAGKRRVLMKKSGSNGQDLEDVETEVNFRVVYSTMDVTATEYKNDTSSRLLLTIASCVAMFSLLKLVGWAYTSKERTEPELLKLGLHCSLPCLDREEQQEEAEAEPLLE